MTAYAMAEATDLAGTQLRALREAYDPYTTERLAGTGVGPGWRCLEIGAGDGSIARWLAHRVLPGGEVLATDLDTRRLASGAGLRVLRHDIGQDPLPTGEFDLVHARLVLQHVPNRREVLARLRAALRPGGWIQIDEFDTSYAPALLTPDGAAGRLYESYPPPRSGCSALPAPGDLGPRVRRRAARRRIRAPRPAAPDLPLAGRTPRPGAPALPAGDAARPAAGQRPD